MLGTHPDYRCRGAGSALVQWGCDVADREGAGAYVDASKAGAPLYERYGFLDFSDPAVPGDVASMGRL
jgi:predicted N-acetyltransferase YhbS